ncbi:MAG TPA: Clp protease N-terminal domain-containing protein, partial [Sandaracinaceae bacterium]
MRLDRLTSKTREALLAAEQRATKAGNPELSPEHLLLTMLEQEGGVAAPIVQKAGADPRAIARSIEQ